MFGSTLGHSYCLSDFQSPVTYIKISTRDSCNSRGWKFQNCGLFDHVGKNIMPGISYSAEHGSSKFTGRWGLKWECCRVEVVIVGGPFLPGAVISPAASQSSLLNGTSRASACILWVHQGTRSGGGTAEITYPNFFYVQTTSATVSCWDTDLQQHVL